MVLLVARPGVPVRADDEIGVAVAVEIPGGTALGPKVRSGLVFRPSVNVIIPRLAKRGGQGQSGDNKKRMAHAHFWHRRPARSSGAGHISLAALGQVCYPVGG